MNKRNKIIVSIVGITIVLLALLGITYAYYLTRIEGNTNTNSISITTADLKLVYSENDGVITANNIMPGTTIEKNFTVTNSGNNKVDNYAVYLEELVNTLSRTEDLTYELTCESTGEDCIGGSGEFPQLAGIITTNSIESGVTHNYKLIVRYANHETIDQSDDMGSKVSALVQLYVLEDIVDIEGIVIGASDGDFAQINSVQKRSQIVDGKYKFAGVLPGTHTIKICGKDDNNCTNPKLEKEIIVNLGTSVGVVDNKITIDDNSQIAIINIDLTQVSESNKVIIESTIKNYNPFTEGSLAYNILNNAYNPSSSTSTIYSSTPLTKVGTEESGENERVLSITQDNYGRSYYYRGSVEDNYLEFNNMCWRIVRIEGDGSIKLALAKEDVCSSITSEDVNSAIIGMVNYGSGPSNYGDIDGDGLDDFEYFFANYEYSSDLVYSSLISPGIEVSSAKSALNIFLNGGTFKSSIFDENGDFYNQSTYERYGVEDKTYIGWSDTLKGVLQDKNICIGDKTKVYDDYGTELEKTYENMQDGFNFDNYVRVTINKTPSLKCVEGALTEQKFKIFPLTVDETIFAGEYLNDNTSFSYVTSSLKLYVPGVTGHVYLSNGETSSGIDCSADFLRPAISLIPNIKWLSGNGTINSPYKINVNN